LGNCKQEQSAISIQHSAPAESCVSVSVGQ
jgi:hypothetical protein